MSQPQEASSLGGEKTGSLSQGEGSKSSACAERSPDSAVTSSSIPSVQSNAPVPLNPTSTSESILGASDAAMPGNPASGAHPSNSAPGGPTHPASRYYAPYPPHGPPHPHGLNPYEGPGPYTAAQYDNRKPPPSGMMNMGPTGSSNPASFSMPQPVPSSGSPPPPNSTRDPPPSHAGQAPYPPAHVGSGSDPTMYPYNREPPPAPPGSWNDASGPPGVYPPRHYYPDYPADTGPYRYSNTTLRLTEAARQRAIADRVIHSMRPPAGQFGQPPAPPPPPPPPRAPPNNPPPAPPTQQGNRAPVLSMFDRLEEERSGATSPSQIESMHKEEVTTMGCTCKKTKCLKLYCQCFAVKIYCGSSCRCSSCHNTDLFEGERREAIRNILVRNPSAFDNKFKKDHAKQQTDGLAHKLGCKCRKSACMKKYCECYAGNVKCSASCRCVGCKNMPRGSGGGPAKRQEPWMMNAAQNLASLKHGSSISDKAVPGRTASSDTEGGSMPSLGSEESTAERKSDETAQLKNGSSAFPVPTSSEKTAVSALLMAAMAMTEMGEPSTPTASANDRKTQGEPDQENPEATQAKDAAPPKNLLEKFNTSGETETDYFGRPKVAQSHLSLVECTQPLPRRQREEGGPARLDEDSPKREHPGNETPSNRQKVKRSRIGSMKKPPRVLESEMAKDHQPAEEEPKTGASSPSKSTTASTTNIETTPAKSSRVDDMILETPKTKDGSAKPPEMTPVSARCIDFRKMQVNETSGTTTQ